MHGENEPVYAIGVVSRIIGVHQQTIRNYERWGLVIPSRSMGGRRYYSQVEVEMIQKIRNFQFDKTRKTYIYGSGLHASLLFKYTNIEQKFNIVGFLDSSKSKNNTKFKNYLIRNPDINNIGRKSNIIIASISSEKTIYNSLKLFRKKGINTYCLYS